MGANASTSGGGGGSNGSSNGGKSSKHSAKTSAKVLDHYEGKSSRFKLKVKVTNLFPVK